VPLLFPNVLTGVVPRFGGATYMYFKDLTLVPIQTKMIDLDLLLPAEEEWMDKYHKQVRDSHKKHKSDMDMMKRVGTTTTLNICKPDLKSPSPSRLQ
jgi:hypothetical protein